MSDLSERQSRPEPGSSKRYKNFYSALQLATQSIASKWTFEDLKECFPTYCEEHPIKAQALRTYLSENIFKVTKDQCDQLLTNHNAAVATDALHEIVLEGRVRKEANHSYASNDIWTLDLSPRSAIHARTIPVLEAERDRMCAELDKLAAENEELIKELEKNEKQKNECDNEVVKKLDVLDEMVTSYESLPLQEMEQWGMDAEESLGNRT